MKWFKEFAELSYWKWTAFRQGGLRNQHYEYFFTDYFQLPLSHYSGKTVLDLGCGPRGSLEWAKQASRRIGLDPLADSYQRLGTSGHSMEYLAAEAEKMPIPDETIDVLSSFNSLDHVRDLDATISEVKRVLKPGGDFLLVVDIHRIPTFTEPQTLRWSLVEDNFSDWEVLVKRRLKRVHPTKIWQNLRKAVPAEPQSTTGVLVVHLRKPLF